MVNFGEIVRLLMDEKKISGVELGKRLGLSRQAVSTMLSDRNSPTLTRIQQVAEALGIPAFCLLMSPAERAQWDTLQAKADPKAHLRSLVESLPLSEVETATDLILSAVQLLQEEQAAKNTANKKKA